MFMLLTRNAWLWLITAAFIYYLLARSGMTLFALKPGNISLLWLPAGVGLVMCLQYGSRALPFIVFASFAANYPGMSADPARAAFLHTAIAALADGMAAILAMHCMQRFLPEGLRHSNELFTFGLLVCLLPAFVSAIVLSLNLFIGGYIASAEVPEMMRILVLVDSLGIILIYQIYAGWLDQRQISTLELRWLASATLLVLLLLWLSFTALPGMLFFIVPALVILSFEVSLLGVATLSSLSLITIIVATANGIGMFADKSLQSANFDLMAFVFAGALTILGIGLQNRELFYSQRSNRFWRVAAEHDVLTGLINRRAFMPRLQYEHQRAVRNGKIYTVAFLDLDYFKTVNDTYGHEAGDKVLRVLAKIMLKNCRAIDSVARIGGEEFAILLPESTAVEASIALERIRYELEQTPVIISNDHSILVTVSIGVASFISNQSSEDDIMARADRALYAAKAAGRNRIAIHEKNQEIFR